MKKILLPVAITAVLSACASGVKINNYSEAFSSFKTGSNKEEFCAQNVKPGSFKEECLHQLIVHERATKACNETANVQSCMRLNKNLWEQEMFKARSLLEGFAFHTGGEVDPLNLHKNLLSIAPKFVLKCSDGSGNIKACASQ